MTAASALLAQSCLGIAMPGRTYASVESRNAWIGDGRQAQVYGGRLAHRFELASGVGITASLSGAGGSMRGDSSAVYLSGFVAASRTLPGLDDRRSACASVGFEVNGVDVPTHSRFIDGNGDGFASAPVTVGVGDDLRAGAWTITPFAAPPSRHQAARTTRAQSQRELLTGGRLGCGERETVAEVRRVVERGGAQLAS